MQIGMIGLGKMGGYMVKRLLLKGHECVVYARRQEVLDEFSALGAVATNTYKNFIVKLTKPRVVWLMVPAATVDNLIDELTPLLDEGDILIDGGNSNYKDDIIRSKKLKEKKINYLDIGTSGGIWGFKRGYCMMIGGDEASFSHIEPAIKDLAPGVEAAHKLEERKNIISTAENGYLYCGPAGAGHFVKMIHNGIEYGIMAAYAEGMNILKHANIGQKSHDIDVETAPLANPENFQYNLNLPDIAELWRRGSVISSWLLDLTSAALAESENLEEFSGRVSDSGEGRWAAIAAIEEGVPAPIITTSLYQRFTSQKESEFGDKLLSALRKQFGGHKEK